MWLDACLFAAAAALRHVPRVTLLSGVQDEAVQLTGGPGTGSAKAAAGLLASCCSAAAVTLGERGCLACMRDGDALAEPAVAGVHVVDATGDFQC